MPDRAQLRERFLHGAGWAKARRTPLAGDASTRSYTRLITARGKRAILMDDPTNDTLRFARVAKHLRDLGLSAPNILVWDPEAGFMLLEDLGDAIVARLCETHPDREPAVYEATVDTLVQLHRQPAPAWAHVFDSGTMTDQAALVLETYAQDTRTDTAKAFRETLRTALAPLDTESRVLLLRDFHAENLIWLPDRQGPARLGLLDFQDAVAGPAPYDLASLIADARRDVTPGLADAVVARYATATHRERDHVAHSVALLSVQRTLRILGVFARLCVQGGKAQYVDLIPRVWDQLGTALNASGTPALEDTILALLPEPTPDFLLNLRSSCGLHPAL